jgi:hypothetical protein
MESGMAKAPARLKTKVLVQKMYPVPIPFSAAAYVCHNIAVMNSGKIVEYGSRRQIMIRCHNTYTSSLLSAAGVNIISSVNLKNKPVPSI